MEQWQIRLQEEYKQLHERYMKLKAYNNKKEVERYTAIETPPITSDADRRANAREAYRSDLMYRQQRTIGEYLHILELRAELEGITLDK